MSVITRETTQRSIPGQRPTPFAFAPRLARQPVWLRDALVIACYVIGAVGIAGKLWKHLGASLTSSNPHDYAFFEFAFYHAAHAVTHLENPLFTDAINAPYGVNMMANTSILGIAIPLTPVTLLGGTGISYAITLTFALSATATAWYFFLRRYVTPYRLIAFVCGGFVGFAPGMISQSSGHPNLVAQFMVPLIVSRVIRLVQESERSARHGLVLGLMVTYQMFINEEILLYTAVAILLMALVYGLSRWEEARSRLKPTLLGCAIAAVVIVALMAYPLWFQFFGPQHYRGPFVWADDYGTNVAAYLGGASESLLGHSGAPNPLAANAAEENSFFGLNLCVLSMIFGVVLWRSFAVRCAVTVGGVLAILSLGNTIKVNGIHTSIPGPWALVSHLPLLDSIIVTRLALMVAAAIGVVLAATANRLLDVVLAVRAAKLGALANALTAAFVAMAFVPVIPTPIPALPKPPVPRFFTDGTWKGSVSGGTILAVPPVMSSSDSLIWAIASGMQAKMADGYFVGPTSATNPIANFGSPVRPTGKVLFTVDASGKVPTVTPAMREQAKVDIAYWDADAFVLDRRREHHDALRQTVNDLLGREGRLIDGVWVWDVRDLRSAEKPLVIGLASHEDDVLAEWRLA